MPSYNENNVVDIKGLVAAVQGPVKNYIDSIKTNNTEGSTVSSENLTLASKTELHDMVSTLFFGSSVQPSEPDTPSEPEIYPSLNTCSVSDILSIIRDGNAEKAWNIGDETAPVTISGTCNGYSIDMTVKFCIIGFDHNRVLETPDVEHTVSFMMRNAESDKDLILVYAQINRQADNTNVGGWRDCYCRNTLIPQAIAGLPVDWQNALLTVNKYTDNSGNSSTNANNVTATQDKMFLPSVWEIFGKSVSTNPYEVLKQAQYTYYENSNNSPIKYRINDVAYNYWLRSPSSTSSTQFYYVSNTGTILTDDSKNTKSMSPIFVLG